MNAQMYDRLVSFAAILILASLAVGAWYLAEKASRQPVVKERAVTHEVDVFMDGFRVIRLDAQGQPTYAVSAKRLVHYPDDDSTEWIEPRAVSLDPQRPPMTVMARRGRAGADAKEIDLMDDVRLTRAATGGHGEARLFTQRLHFDTERDFASTDSAVRMERDQSVLEAIGMEVDNKNRTLLLKSQVRAVVPPRDLPAQ